MTAAICADVMPGVGLGCFIYPYVFGIRRTISDRMDYYEPLNVRRSHRPMCATPNHFRHLIYYVTPSHNA